MTRIAVIGGGPAGAAAAITLALRGRDVVVFEKGLSTRRKVCGEFYSPECWGDLEALGARGAVERLRPRLVRRVVLSAPSGETSFPFRQVAGESPFALDRRAHDEALLARALEVGVDVRQGVDVRRVGDDCSVEGEPFDLVIDASGRHPVTRAGDPVPDVKGRPLGFRATFDGFGLAPEAVELHVVAGAYVGAVEVEAGRTNVCLLTTPGRAREAAGNSDELLARIAAENPALRDRLRVAKRTSPWDAVGAVASGFRGTRSRTALCIGDAAGTVEPFSGEGIAMALRGGRRLAEAILAHGEAAAARFEPAWRRELRPRVWTGRALNLFATRPHLAGVLVRLVDRRPSVGEWLVRATR